MKKLILLLCFAPLLSSAQNRGWLEVQAVQHVALGKWNDADLARQMMPATSMTELRLSCKFSPFAGRQAGVYADMGLGVMPGSRRKDFTLEGLPMPSDGERYFLRERVSHCGGSNAQVKFKMSGGVWGDIAIGAQQSLRPHLGVGFLSMIGRDHTVRLKEEGTNMEYFATYHWGVGSADDYHPTSLGYVVGRVDYTRRLPRGKRLLVGLEYTHFTRTMDFDAKFVNAYNYNVQRRVVASGRQMGMLAVSVGVQFK